MSRHYDKYPTIHALGLGPALDEVERVFAHGAAGKYAGQAIDRVRKLLRAAHGMGNSSAGGDE